MKSRALSGRSANPKSSRRETRAYPAHGASGAQLHDAVDEVNRALNEVPQADNEPGAVERMLRANGILRNVRWPPPFHETTHQVTLGDARSLSWIPEESVHEKAQRRLSARAAPSFDEFQLLPFRATNVAPFPFEWVNYAQAAKEYAALFVRVSREYDRRFP